MIFKRKAHGLYFTVELSSTTNKFDVFLFFSSSLDRSKEVMQTHHFEFRRIHWLRTITLELNRNWYGIHKIFCFSNWITTICYTMYEWHDEFVDDMRRKIPKIFHKIIRIVFVLIRAWIDCNQMESLLVEYAAVCIVVSRIFGIASEGIGIILQIYFSREWKTTTTTEIANGAKPSLASKEKKKKLDSKTMDLRTKEKKYIS